ncbi:MAG: hypothetical protein K8I00_01255, partial [Candidatus Omnitrophica bacterium]|nr:hypothetical protein [Candidatus Omnitrophota bacterium]
TRTHVGMAEDLNVMIAPVGEAFAQVLDTREDISLFQRDGRHPSTAGTYLAACVIYATIFQKSPYGLEYSAGLEPGKARYLQDLAGEIVFRGYKRWNVPDPRAKR